MGFSLVPHFFLGAAVAAFPISVFFSLLLAFFLSAHLPPRGARTEDEPRRFVSYRRAEEDRGVFPFLGFLSVLFVCVFLSLLLAFCAAVGFLFPPLERIDIIITYGGVFVVLFPRVASSLLGVVRLCFLSSVFLRTWVQQQQQLKLEKQDQQKSKKASRDSKSPVPAAVFFFPFVFSLAVGGRWPLFSVT